MIYPQQNRLKHWVLDTYVRWSVKRNFHHLKVDKVEVSPDKSVLLIANHFSYWDGMILYYLNQQITGKKFHAMILEETAIKEPMLKYAGGFSVKKNSRDILESLRFAVELLNDPQNMVLIFPQGKLYSNFIGEVTFEPGVSKIMQQAEGKFQLMLAAIFAENFEHKKQVVNVYISNDEQPGSTDATAVQKRYQQHYDRARAQQTKIVL